MKRRFKTRKRRKRIIKVLTYLFIIYCSFYICFNFLIKLSSNYIKDTNREIKIFNYGLNELKLPEFNLFKPNNILSLSLNTVLDNKSYKSGLKLLKEEENIVDPTVYIYNSHQTEEYDSAFNNAYNISYTVWAASYILKDYLKEYNINAIVEDNSISDYLKNNNLRYKDSYKASRVFISDKLSKYPTIKYIIDIHRDSSSKELTTAYIDNIAYAKILFVIGGDNPGFNNNYLFASNINKNIDSRITKGIIKKEGSKVNGVYNQDLISSAVLIEVGGKENNIEEVSNSLKVFANAFYKEITNE